MREKRAEDFIDEVATAYVKNMTESEKINFIFHEVERRMSQDYEMNEGVGLWAAARRLGLLDPDEETLLI